MADFLIKAGADIELGCSTPLMEAAQEGHLELVKYLLAAGTAALSASLQSDPQCLAVLPFLIQSKCLYALL